MREGLCLKSEDCILSQKIVSSNPRALCTNSTNEVKFICEFSEENNCESIKRNSHAYSTLPPSSKHSVATETDIPMESIVVSGCLCYIEVICVSS